LYDLQLEESRLDLRDVILNVKRFILTKPFFWFYQLTKVLEGKRKATNSKQWFCPLRWKNHMFSHTCSNPIWQNLSPFLNPFDKNNWWHMLLFAQTYKWFASRFCCTFVQHISQRWIWFARKTLCWKRKRLKYARKRVFMRINEGLFV